MSDEADQTDARTAGEIESMLTRVRLSPKLVPSGLCYYCDAAVDAGRTFCPGEDCRDDYEREQTLMARSGRR